ACASCERGGISHRGSWRRRSTCRGRRSTRSSRTATRRRCPWRSRWLASSGRRSRRCSMPMKLTRSKWFLPLFAVALGLVILVAQWIGGNPVGGLESLGIMTAFGALLLLGGRSETIRGLRGDGRDERFRRIDIRATALSGLAVTTAIIVAFIFELARGHSGMPYAWLGAICGLA